MGSFAGLAQESKEKDVRRKGSPRVWGYSGAPPEFNPRANCPNDERAGSLVPGKVKDVFAWS